MKYEYIDNPEQLEEAVTRLTGVPVLGVDTEAAGYHRYHDRISLVQISSPDENILFDPIAVQDFSPLESLFADAQVVKIFHDADFDLRILDRDLGLHIRGLFDTQLAAAFLGERSLGLGAIVEKYLGLTLPKAYQRADWAERPLTEGMKEYAATDTAHLPVLRERLFTELDRLGRRPWAEEEFTRREAIRWNEPDSASSFLRIKGSRDLSPRGLAILRELHRWREKVGEERDQATFRVLSNQALIEMSGKAPATLREIRAISGMSPGLVDRRGQELIAAIERGLEVPEDELPSFPPARRWERDPQVEERADRLRQERNRVAAMLDLDPGFLISRSVLDEIARRHPRSIDELSAIDDVRQWQVEVLGQDLLRVMES